MKSTKNINLKDLFLDLQSEMIAGLKTTRKNVRHSGEKGEASESKWLEMLKRYLPERYQLAKGFIIDHDGNLSHEIDIIIFDRHYSPFLFNHDGTLYIPAESVYATLEVKQSMGKGEVEYAGAKAESVRRLKRTSMPIPHAGGTYEPKKPARILAGFISLASTWKSPFGKSFESVIQSLPEAGRLDFGCVLESGSFEITYDEKGSGKIIITPENALISFFLNLLTRLQQLATVPMLDVAQYAKSLKK